MRPRFCPMHQLPAISRVSMTKFLIRGPSNSLVCMRKGTWLTASSLALESLGLALSSRYLYNLPFLGFPSSSAHQIGAPNLTQPCSTLSRLNDSLAASLHSLSPRQLFDPLAPLSVCYHYIAFTSSWGVAEDPSCASYTLKH